MRATAWVVTGVVACSVAAFAAELHEGAPRTPPAQPATPPRVTVEMTAATLADDCGGAVPTSPPVRRKSRAEAGRNDAVHGARIRRQCEQTSMQLSVVAPAGVEPTRLRVKSVELFDENGERVGTLTPRSPTVWSATGVYQTWDETIAPSQTLSVSYALSQPDWAAVTERWNKTFVVRAVLTVGGTEQTVQHDVLVSAETSLPPNVRT